jgi:hypothetical protein
MSTLPKTTTHRDSVAEPEVVYVSPEEGRRMFDEVARQWTGLSGEEFIRRWEAGEYADMVESEDNRHVVELVLMIPFARQEG